MSRIVAAAAVAAAVVVALLPVPEGVPSSAMHAGALCLVIVGLWATGAISEYVTALLFFLLATIFEVAPAGAVFSGFGSGAWWLVLGGMFVGYAVRDTGLGERLARGLIRVFAGSYFRILLGIAVACTVLAFLIPSSMVRVIIVVPIIVALADRLGFGEGSPGRAGMILTAAVTTFTAAAGILPANVVNMVYAGMTESLYGIHQTYGSYLLLHFPAQGLVKPLLITVLAWVMFRAEPAPAPAPREAVPVDPRERRLALILGVTLALWMTDFLHGVSPAWVALGAAVACLLPRLGVVTADKANSGLQVGPLVYVAAILGLGQVVAVSGLGDAVSGALLAEADGAVGDGMVRFLTVTVGTMVMGLATTLAALPAIMGPLAGDVAVATGLPLQVVLMIQVVAFSTIVLPFQMPPLVVAMQLGGVRLAEAARLTLALTAVTILLVNPMIYLFWWVLGLVG